MAKKLSRLTVKKAMGFLFIVIMLTILLRYSNQIEQNMPKDLPPGHPELEKYQSIQNGIKIAGLLITVGGIIYVIKLKE